MDCVTTQQKSNDYNILITSSSFCTNTIYALPEVMSSEIGATETIASFSLSAMLDIH